MGMFDSFYDASGVEWQTKALGRSLERWDIGDRVPVAFACQMEGINGRNSVGVEVALATVRGGVLTEVTRTRDEPLPLIPYGGLGATPYGDYLSTAEGMDETGSRESEYEAGYQKAIADLRWLADKRNEYGGPRNVQNVTDYFALSETDKRLYDEVKDARHVADILSGENDGGGWLPSWRWDEWEARRTSETPRG